MKFASYSDETNVVCGLECFVLICVDIDAPVSINSLYEKILGPNNFMLLIVLFKEKFPSFLPKNTDYAKWMHW